MKILDRVTVTGPDDETQFEDLFRLSEKYPFVEWGILISKKMGRPCFPTQQWLEDLSVIWLDHFHKHKVMTPFALHVCGEWVREMCQTDWKVFEFLSKLESPVWAMFDRMQLNLQGKYERSNGFHQEMHAQLWPRQIIFQLDNNHEIIKGCQTKDPESKKRGTWAALFDISGGRGELPEEWPKPIPGIYCGYAGGLTPNNLESQMEKIAQVVPKGLVWIDTQSGVRTDNTFDIVKVERFLEIASNWVIEQ